MFTKKRLIVAVVSLAVGIILVVTYYYNAVETKPFHGSKHPPKSVRLSQSDLADKILDLESKVDDLENKNNDLESKIDNLEGIGVVSKIDKLQDKIEGVFGLEDKVHKLEDKVFNLDLNIRHPIPPLRP